MAETIITKARDRYYLHRYVFPFVKRNRDRVITKDNTICLFCHPRGGSTWLAEILLQIPNSCLIDEPLQKGKINGAGIIIKQPYRNAFNVAGRRYYDEQPIPPEADWPDGEKLLTDIISGRIDALSLYEEAGIERLKNAETYIVKFNFAHLTANFLLNHFPVKAILLTRHPCAVVASQLKISIFTKNDFKRKREFPESKFKEVFEKYERIYETVTSFEEYLAFIWSLKVRESLYAKRNINNRLIVAYETLLTDFFEETQRIFKWIGKDVPDKITELQFKPSVSTKSHSLKRIKTKQQLTAWKNDLSQKQINKILNIVEKFEIDIYSDDPEPNYDILYNM